MTASGPLRGRRASRPWGAWARAWRFGLAVALAATMACLPRVDATTTERVVSDRLTGLAMNGIDPVAYFTDAAPLYGRAEQEYRYAGVIWRVRKEGNTPASAAYDPIAVGRAVAVPGNPLVWTVVGERLYLFYSEEARARFIANPDEAIL